MESLTLAVMTPELCHALYKEWENDEATYMDMSLFKPFSYNAEAVHRYFQSRQEPSRILFAVMLGDKPIGELQLKSIDQVRKECTLSRLNIGPCSTPFMNWTRLPSTRTPQSKTHEASMYWKKSGLF